MTEQRELPGAYCLACGADDVRSWPTATAMVRSAFGAEVVRCAACSATFLWPQPSRMDDVYEEEYFDAYAEAGLEQVAEAHLDRLGERLRSVPLAPGRLLDIGVGRGGFLRLARRLGWDVAGLDVSRWAARQLEEDGGIHVTVGTLEDAPFPPGSFDVVHMSHVLEHLASPLEALRRVRELLSESGRLIVEVPNEFENLATALQLKSATARPYAVASTHLWFFTPATLERVIRDAGLHVERSRTFRDTLDARLGRRVAKRVVDQVEQVLQRGPLIEIVARR